MSDAIVASPSPSDTPVETGARRHPVLRFIAIRLAVGVVTLFAASLVVFVGTSVVPGSPAGAVLGRQASPEEIAEVNHRLGFDRPLITRYVDWLGGVVRGNLGDSAIALVQGRDDASSWSIISSPFRNTMILALLTVVFLIPVSLLVGTICGVTAGRWPDHLLSTLTLVLIALPEFVVGSLLVVLLSIKLDVLPAVSLLAPGANPLSRPEVLVMPVLTLLAVSIAFSSRLVRTGTIEVLDSDYVQTARLHGIAETRVMTRYVLRNSLAPSVQIFALTIQYLFGGVVVTEAVFNYPGLGNELVDAVSSSDAPTVQAIAMLLATIYILINILADVIVVLLVPKLRTAV